MAVSALHGVFDASSLRALREPLESSPVSRPLVRAKSTSAAQEGPGYPLQNDTGPSALDAVFRGFEGAPRRVLRLSPLGAIVARDLLRAPLAKGAVHEVRITGLGRVAGPLRARVACPREGEAVEALEFIEPPLTAGRDILALVRDLARHGRVEPAAGASPVHEVIVDPARITQLLVALAGAGGLGVIVAEGRPRVRIVSVDVERGLVQWEGAEGLGAGPRVVEITGYNSVYSLHLARFDAQRGRAVSPLPSRVDRARQRWFRRGRVEGALAVEYEHPLWPELPRERRPLRDISYGGLCFAIDGDRELLFPGLRLPLEIRRGGRPVLLDGEVRFVLPAQGDEPAVCGVSVRPWTPDDDAAWGEIVTKALHRTTSAGPAWTEATWELFDVAGYFNLSGKSPGEFDALRRSFVEVVERTADRARLSCQAVWPSGRGVEASCSVLKPYSGTWMLHQVAKRRGDPRARGGARNVLRDVYLRTFEHAQSDPSLRWAISYVEANVPWMQRSHVAFARLHAASGLAMAMPFQLMEGSCADRGAGGAGGFECGPASFAEKMRLLNVLAQTRPAPYVESLDLVPERFESPVLDHAWRDAGLERSRAVIVARRGRHAIAAAIVETGEAGTNLFRLLDSARVFALAPGGREAFVALLDAVRGWFAARGRSTFIHFCEDAEASYARAAHLRDLGAGRFWAVAAPLLPEFLEFVCEIAVRPPQAALESPVIPPSIHASAANE